MKFHVLVMLVALATGVEAAFPGRIEAEDWDAFQDNASSPGTQGCSDLGGGLNVGWIDAGEWLAYDVTVATAGDYRLTVRAASAVGGVKQVRLLVDDVDVTGPMAIPHSDGWQTWHSTGFAPVPLAAGSHRLKLVFDTGNLNLNWLELEPYVPVPPAAPGLFALGSADTGTAAFTWLDSFDDETGFKLYVSSTDEKPALPSLTLPPGSTSANVVGLAPGQPHFAWLEAVNAAGNGAAAQTRFTTLTTALPASIPVGAGSYASYPPYNESSPSGFFQNYALNPTLSLAADDQRPVPTNDWWTHLLFNRFGSALWSYPHMTRTSAEGFRVHFPRSFNGSGSQIQAGAHVTVGGDAFAPLGTIAKDWSDWSVVARMEGDGKAIDATVAHGVPFTFFEFENLTPTIQFSTAATITDAAGTPVTFPITTSMLRVTLDGGNFGLHFPDGTTVSQNAGVLTSSSPLLTVSALPNATALAEFHAFAFNIPRETRVDWDFDPASSELDTTWALTTENPTGAPAGDTLQGFLPHHLNGSLSHDFTVTPHSYTTTRGPLTLASGRTFNFSYRWHGILPHYPVPGDLTGPAPWRPEVMNQIITEYAATANYGTDTYWGGKGLVNLGKYMLFARELNHPSYPAIKAKLKEALADWLTYTPGETSRFYASYPRWGAVVGFDESYYSYQFTDHHFHYGYLIHAAALMAMDEPGWIAPYEEMLKLVAKEYANWDRDDSNFPVLRTFDPWIGHSYAGGTGSPGGNNQESTSEAIQSWAGLFFLGTLLGDDDMRDTGAFGYQAETNATMEYWFNRSGNNWPATYAAGHDVVGILWNDGFSYGTFFSGAPHHIYGIQWLPVCPAFKHVVQGVNKQWSDDLYQGLMDRILVDYQTQGNPAAADGVITEPEVGTDWANVLLGARLFSDPGYVTGRLEQWRTSSNSAELNTVFSDVGGLTYYYSHAHQTWGDIDWDVAMSIPTSTAFVHPVTGQATCVVFNPSAEEQTCEVRRNGQLIGSFRVPALKTVAHHLDAGLATIVVSAPATHVVLGESVQLHVAGFDQYGATWDLGAVSLTTTVGGVVNPDGLFTALAKTDQVVITATQGSVSGTLNLRIGDPLSLASLRIEPAHLRVLAGGSASFQATGRDAYGLPFPLPAVSWSTDAGVIDAAGVLTAPPAPALVTVTASAGGKSATALVTVHQPLSNLALARPATATSVLGGNTAAKAVDGNPSTRWESTHGLNNQSLTVDLGAVFDLTRIVLKWETAAAASYTIDVSTDGVVWTTVHTDLQGNAGTDEIVISAVARHVRMSGLTRTTGYGFSLWEFEAYGHPHASTLVTDSLRILPGEWSLKPGGSTRLQAFAFTPTGAGGDVAPSWSADAGAIDPTGQFSAPASPGAVNVSASYGSLSASAVIHVLEAPHSGYEAWRAAQFPPGEASDPSADPDHDGLQNLAEFYLALDPMSGDMTPNRLEVKLLAAGEVELRFQRSLAAAAEISLRIESSADLVQWTPFIPASLERTATGPGEERLIVRAPHQGERRHYRLGFTAD